MPLQPIQHQMQCIPATQPLVMHSLVEAGGSLSTKDDLVCAKRLQAGDGRHQPQCYIVVLAHTQGR